MKPRLVIFLLLLGWMGCGYRTSSLTPGEARSVAIPIVENTSFRIGLEFQMTRALIDEMQSRGSLKVVPRAEADTELLGRISQYKRPVLSKDAAGLPTEARVEISADVVWKDLRTQKMLLESKNITATADYAPARGEREEEARATAMARLARQIVEVMQHPW